MSDTTITSTMPSVSATTPATTTGTGLKGTTDEFLKLFMAQLQQQDPFNPTSGADMVAQLAQLSSVEQAKQTNTELSDISAAQSSAASAGLSSLIGRDCSATAGTFSIASSGGAPPPVGITSTSATKGASIVIDDANGKEIRRIPIPDGSTATSIQWDGKDANGAAVPPGNYKLAVDTGKGTGTIDAQWQGKVSAVELTADGPRLRIGDVLLAPSDIRTIGAGSAAASATTSIAALSRTILNSINGAKA
jgi:flagellar basal-body rod modification protein FlgD